MDNVKLDWRAYWMEFQRLHGGDPVLCMGRWLFRDGWMYAKSDYRGPEWPAPKDPKELRELKVAYWEGRAAVVRASARDVLDLIADLTAAQRGRSAPLQRVVRRDDHLVREPLDLRFLQDRLDWLRRDEADCAKQLEELNAEAEREHQRV